MLLGLLRPKLGLLAPNSASPSSLLGSLTHFSTLKNVAMMPTHFNKLEPLGILCASAMFMSPTVSNFLVNTSGCLATSGQQVRYRRTYITKSRRFHGHIDLYDKQGKRETFKPAEDRFRRLNWGVYIRTRMAKDNKRWKQTERRLWRREQHVFAWREHILKFERMFSNETKRPRYFPNDPYEKYNRTSFWKHFWTKLKNIENIKRHGNDIYLWDTYKAHLKLKSSHNKLPKMYYMPPGYLQNVASNPAGVYTGDPLIPKVDKVDHFQREHLRPPKIKSTVRVPFLNKWIHAIRKMEPYSPQSQLEPWSLLFHSRTFQK